LFIAGADRRRDIRTDLRKCAAVSSCERAEAVVLHIDLRCRVPRTYCAIGSPAHRPYRFVANRLPAHGVETQDIDSNPIVRSEARERISGYACRAELGSEIAGDYARDVVPQGRRPAIEFVNINLVWPGLDYELGWSTTLGTATGPTITVTL
jgi:hypothetical protein